MNESSNDLSYELQQLSGWLYDGRGGYSLGYLLRKLQPTNVSFYAPIIQLKMSALRKKNYETNQTDYIEYAFQWRNFQSKMSDFICNADTPEDAACKLAIELFKQDILTTQIGGEES